MAVRSNAKKGQPLPAPADEMEYCSRLNRALPPDIRVLGWTDVPDDFHARSAHCRARRQSRASRCCAYGARGVGCYGEEIYIVICNMLSVHNSYRARAKHAMHLQRGVHTDHCHAASAAERPETHRASYCRFGVSTREYKYFLLLHGGEDLDAMRAGAALFVGEHDFRNFCKVLLDPRHDIYFIGASMGILMQAMLHSWLPHLLEFLQAGLVQ